MVASGEIVTLEGPEGERLFDLAGLEVVDGDTAAPVRLLAPFDNVVVAQADRRRIVDAEVFPHLINGQSPGFVLVDGRVGAWKPPGRTARATWTPSTSRPSPRATAGWWPPRSPA